MAYIDPDGIFNGDRMSLLSDEAKLYWPYFWCASNTAGRIELNYRKVMKRAFGHFTLPPTEEMFWRWAREYREAFLLFTYKHNGQIWGQWDVTARYLPKHTLAADSKTPAPDGAAMSAWKDQYITQKSARQGKTLERDTPSEAEQQLHDFANPIPANNFAHLEKVLTERRDLGSGSDVGNGNGEEKTNTPQPPSGGLLVAGPIAQRKQKPGKRPIAQIEGALGTSRLTWWKDFWSIYPCHEGKRAAMDAFERVVKTPDQWAKVRAGAIRYQERSSADPEMRLKFGQGWINGERWEDEYSHRPAARPNAEAQHKQRMLDKAREMGI